MLQLLGEANHGRPISWVPEWDSMRVVTDPFPLLMPFCGFGDCDSQRWPEYGEQSPQSEEGSHGGVCSSMVVASLKDLD